MHAVVKCNTFYKMQFDFESLNDNLKSCMSGVFSEGRFIELGYKMKHAV